MSWSNLNSFELQAVRKLLMLDVSEAAECIGKVSNRTWQYWEAGKYNIPTDVDMEMYGLCQMRNDVLDKTLESQFDNEALKFDEPPEIKWYHDFEAFLIDYPSSNKVAWRMHQSVCAALFIESNESVLSADAALDKESYIYKFFSHTRDEDLEQQKQESIFNAREKAKNKAK